MADRLGVDATSISLSLVSSGATAWSSWRGPIARSETTAHHTICERCGICGFERGSARPARVCREGRREDYCCRTYRALGSAPTARDARSVPIEHFIYPAGAAEIKAGTRLSESRTRGSIGRARPGDAARGRAGERPARHARRGVRAPGGMSRFASLGAMF